MALGVGQRLKPIGKMTAAVMAALIAPQVGRDELADAVGYVENAGAPSAVTPDFIGQKLFDTTNSDFYIAFGTSSGNWVPIGLDTLSAAEMTFLDGALAGTAVASKAVVLDASGNVNTIGLTTITGVAAAQGTGVTVTGGTSSTAGNAGGAVALVGGTPGVTGIGGAVNLTGAAGGATSGAGGAVVLAGGAGTAGNAAGGAFSLISGAGQGSAASGIATVASGAGGATGASGAVSIASGTGGATSGVSGAITVASGTTTSGASGAVTVGSGNATGGVPGTTTLNAGSAQTAATAGGAVAITAGAGNTSGAGGALSITSGAAGNTGVAGAVAISVGAATAGNGSSMTLTAGNGAGSTNAGGSINLVPGAAVSTGVPGEIKVNGDANLVFATEALTATDATRTLMVCTRPLRLQSAKSVFSTASSSGTWQLEKCTGTTAPGSGTSLLTGTVALSGTANSPNSGTLIGTVASITLAAGDRLGIVIAGSMTNLVGGRVTVGLSPA